MTLINRLKANDSSRDSSDKLDRDDSGVIVPLRSVVEAPVQVPPPLQGPPRKTRVILNIAIGLLALSVIGVSIYFIVRHFQIKNDSTARLLEEELYDDMAVESEHNFPGLSFEFESHEERKLQQEMDESEYLGYIERLGEF